MERRRRGWRLGVPLAAAVGMLLITASLTSGAAIGWDAGDYVDTYTLTNLVLGSALAGSGLMIGWHRPRNAIGILFAVAGLAHLLTAALSPAVPLGIEQGWPVWSTRLMAGLFLGSWALGVPTLAMLALVLFPDGHLPSPRWRPAVWYFLAMAAASFTLSMVNPYDLVEGSISSRPLLAIEGLPVAQLEAVVDGWLSMPAAFIVLAALITRFVRGGERVRRQLMWLILAVIFVLVVNMQRYLTGEGPVLLLLSVTLIPAAVAIAVIRYRLLDIRFVLSRTVLYGLLLAVVVTAYAGMVAALTSVVPADADRTVAIAAAVVVALLFNPLRILLQRMIGRAFYGSRDDPARTMVGLSSDGSLTEALGQLRRALRLPHLAITAGGEVIAAEGTEPDDAVRAALPLDVHAGAASEETAGRPDPGDMLRVTLRAGERRLHAADRRALALVLPALALLLREQRLQEELRQARALTARAREQERKTLHRDLHDGLGPTLTGAAMRLDAAANLLSRDVQRARTALVEGSQEVRTAIDEVRRVVYGLRPVALDDAGLLGALREQTRIEQGPVVRLQASEPLPPLTPATELAAYRVIMEALTNARRHSDATSVHVRLTAEEGGLRILVEDDGPSREHPPPGAGIRSLHERVDELGGSALVGPTPTGWRVQVRLPL